MTMKRINWFGVAFIAIAVICVLAFLSVRAANAQDATPLPTGDLPTTPSGVIALFTLFGGTLVVSAVTGFLKMFLPESISADTVKEYVAIVAVVLYLALGYSGHADWFGTGADIVAKVAPLVGAIIGAFQGSSVAHQLSAKVGVPVLGYKRS